MARRLVGANPLYKPMLKYCYWDLLGGNSDETLIQIKIF